MDRDFRRLFRGRKHKNIFVPVPARRKTKIERRVSRDPWEAVVSHGTGFRIEPRKR